MNRLNPLTLTIITPLGVHKMQYTEHSFEIDGKRIIYYLFSTKRKNVPVKNYEIYGQSYALWKKNWDHYFNVEHNDNKIIYSNDFTDHDECLSLFYQGDCIANCLFKNFDTKDPTSIDDRYFSIWNDFFLKSLFKKNNNIKVCTYFSIKEEFKKDHFDISIKNLLFIAAFKAFLDSNSSAMLATLRTKHSMGKLGTFYGGRVIENDKVHHRHLNNQAEFVDLVVFNREETLINYQRSDFYNYLETDAMRKKIKKAA